LVEENKAMNWIDMGMSSYYNRNYGMAIYWNKKAFSIDLRIKVSFEKNKEF
jgi:hypothetical protein